MDGRALPFLTTRMETLSSSCADGSSSSTSCFGRVIVSMINVFFHRWCRRAGCGYPEGPWTAPFGEPLAGCRAWSSAGPPAVPMGSDRGSANRFRREPSSSRRRAVSISPRADSAATVRRWVTRGGTGLRWRGPPLRPPRARRVVRLGSGAVDPALPGWQVADLANSEAVRPYRVDHWSAWSFLRR